MVEIKLLGELGRKFGRVWHLNIRTPKEALKAIAVNCNGFYEYITECDTKGIYWRVVIDDPLGIDEEQLDYPVGKQLIIAPIVTGSGGVGKILLGAALIAASAFMPASILGISSLSIGMLGGAMVLGGISKMLSPSPGKPKTIPKGNADNQKTDSFLFDRASEIGDEGGSVPVLYGERIVVDPILISSSIRIEQLALADYTSRINV